MIRSWRFFMKKILKWNQLKLQNEQNWYAGLFLDQNDGDWFGLIIYKVFQRVMTVTRNNRD